MMRACLALCSLLLLAACAAPSQEARETLPSTALERIDLYGDLRLRLESTFDRDGKRDRDRARMRGRLGANYQVSDDVRVGTRLVTGNKNDPNSTHVTLGDGFDSYEVSLDRLFIDYRPTNSAGTRLTAGKFDPGFGRNPVYGELVWDGDIQPEGALIRQSVPDVLGLDSVELALGGYVVEEQADAEDSSLWVTQIAGTRQLGEQRSARLSLVYYHYPDPTPDGSSTLVQRSNGNAVEGSSFVSDFGVLDAVASLRIGDDRPWVFSGEFIHNTRAENRGDGWATGVAYGKTAQRGDWRAYYQWQVVEQDSVFSAFAQDDFVLRSNHRSHVAGYQRKLTNDIELHLWGLFSETDRDFDDGSSEDGAWRLRVDLNVKF